MYDRDNQQSESIDEGPSIGSPFSTLQSAASDVSSVDDGLLQQEESQPEDPSLIDHWIPEGPSIGSPSMQSTASGISTVDDGLPQQEESQPEDPSPVDHRIPEGILQRGQPVLKKVSIVL